MKKQNYPKGWNDARIRRVIEFYDSQSDDEVAAEIEAASKTLMEIPTALVSDVRELIAKRRSTRARPAPTAKRRVQRNKARTA
jgi:hypothetical protein